jgi:hypothetical protein
MIGYKRMRLFTEQNILFCKQAHAPILEQNLF